MKKGQYFSFRKRSFEKSKMFLKENFFIERGKFSQCDIQKKKIHFFFQFINS